MINVKISMGNDSQKTAVQAAEPKLVQGDLYFGRNFASGGEVTEAEFQAFIDAEITPQFPDGLTVYATDRQFLDNTGNLIQEPSQVMTLIFEDTLENQAKIDRIRESYQQQFQQESVLEVVNEDQLKISFDEATDLIDQDLTPELIQEDLYFGRNIANGGEVSAAEFQTFIDTEITPRFPDGLTVYDAEGQFLDSTGSLIQEPSQVISLIFEDTAENEQGIDQLIAAYKQQFQQESVLEVVNEEVNIGFGESADLIDNDLIPEVIQEDLYFGRNIIGGGEVSEAEFQEFLDQEITPRFADGVTVYEADGQFLDSTDTLIQEPSKVVSLIFEDNLENEAAIDQIIQAYKQQFQQESVLQVVDEELNITLDTEQDYEILPEKINRDSLTGATRVVEQNLSDDAIAERSWREIASTETNIDFVAANQQILLSGLDFEGIQQETTSIYSDQLTLGQTTDDHKDVFDAQYSLRDNIDNNVFEQYRLSSEQILSA
jgi:hypothetical protein